MYCNFKREHIGTKQIVQSQLFGKNVEGKTVLTGGCTDNVVIAYFVKEGGIPLIMTPDDHDNIIIDVVQCPHILENLIKNYSSCLFRRDKTKKNVLHKRINDKDFMKTFITHSSIPNLKRLCSEKDLDGKTPLDILRSEEIYEMLPASVKPEPTKKDRSVSLDSPMSAMSVESPMSAMSVENPMSAMSVDSPMSAMSTESPMSAMSTESPMSAMSVKTLDSTPLPLVKPVSSKEVVKEDKEKKAEERERIRQRLIEKRNAAKTAETEKSSYSFFKLGIGGW